jgi:DDE superfamily endonuclease
MLDHFKCHLQTSFISELGELGFDVDYIPAGYTCVLQPCDVDVNAPFKRSTRYQHSEWCIKINHNLQPKQKFPVLQQKDIVEWVENSYAKITVETTRKTF